MKLTKKELADIIYEAIKCWDMNPMSKYFANELATMIKTREEEK